MKRYIAMALLLAAPALGAAQTSDKPANPDGPPRREGHGFGMREGHGVAGTINEITKDGLTLTTRQGKTVTVKITGETRFMKERQPAKLAEFKPGDFVIIIGEPAGEDTWTARVVGSGAQMDMQAIREGMGKQFIAGEVKAVDGTKLTIVRPDGETQTIEVDENTSFRKGRESITLPDIKVGDHVFGRGQLDSAGVFVPRVLNLGEIRMMMGGGGERQPAPPQQPPR